MERPAHRIPLNAVLSLQEGNLIEAIKHTREETGSGLKESKAAVEGWLAANPEARQLYLEAASRARGGTGKLLWVVALGVCAALATLKLLGKL